MVRYLKDENYQSLYYKKIPAIFSRKSSDEDLHSLYMLGANLIRREICPHVLALEMSLMFLKIGCKQ